MKPGSEATDETRSEATAIELAAAGCDETGSPKGFPGTRKPKGFRLKPGSKATDETRSEATAIEPAAAGCVETGSPKGFPETRKPQASVET